MELSKEEIIRMARESGLGWVAHKRLERFAALVAAHWQKIHEQEMSMMSELCADRILEEREKCALVCITLGEYYAECDDFDAEDVAHACASSIRESEK